MPSNIVSGSRGGEIQIWNSVSYILINQFKAHTASVNVLAILPSNNFFLSGSTDTTIKVWDTTLFQLMNTMSGHTTSVNALAFSSQYIFSGSSNIIKVWDISSFTFLRDITESAGSTGALLFIASTNILIRGNPANAKIFLYSTTTFSSISTNSNLFNEPSGSIRFAYLPKKQQFVSASWNDVKVWDSTTFMLLANLIGHTQWVNALGVLDSTQSIITGSSDLTIKIWDSSSFQCIATLKGFSGAVRTLAVIPSIESIIFAASAFQVWKFNEFSYFYNLIGHTDSVYGIDYLQNNRLASVSLDQAIFNWDLTSGQVFSVNNQTKSKFS